MKLKLIFTAKAAALGLLFFAVMQLFFWTVYKPFLNEISVPIIFYFVLAVIGWDILRKRKNAVTMGAITLLVAYLPMVFFLDSEIKGNDKPLIFVFIGVALSLSILIFLGFILSERKKRRGAGEKPLFALSVIIPCGLFLLSVALSIVILEHDWFGLFLNYVEGSNLILATLFSLSCMAWLYFREKTTHPVITRLVYYAFITLSLLLLWIAYDQQWFHTAKDIWFPGIGVFGTWLVELFLQIGLLVYDLLILAVKGIRKHLQKKKQKDLPSNEVNSPETV